VNALKITDSPNAIASGVSGRFVVIVGGASIASVTESEPVEPPKSVAVAVIVCEPTERLELEKLPEPIAPSRLELQTGTRAPSSGSVAVAANETAFPCGTVENALGEVIETVGGELLGV
jgi:hypothetical protein